MGDAYPNLGKHQHQCSSVWGEVVVASSDLPPPLTSGFNVENVEYKNISFTVWDVGGQDRVSGAYRSAMGGMGIESSFLLYCKGGPYTHLYVLFGLCVKLAVNNPLLTCT